MSVNKKDQDKDIYTHKQGIYISSEKVINYIMHGATQSQLREVEIKLDKRIGATQNQLREVEANLRQDMHQLDTKIDSNFKWMIGTMVTLFVAMIGVIIVK